MLRWTATLVALVTLLAAPLLSQARNPSAAPEIVAKTPTQAPAPATRQLTRSDLEPWLDGFMPYALQRGGIAGATVAVVKDGQIVLAKGYGYADMKKRIPVSAERTLFRPGSVSKLFTWTAVMQLVEQGKLDLDEDVNAYLDFKIPPRDGKPVTLRSILTHTAGFEERVKGLITPDVKNVQTLGDYYRGWVPDRIYPVGSTPAYSNYATGLAGYIVERVSGQSFDDYIDQHILLPLGMTNSSFRQPLPPRLLANMSQGYNLSSEDPQPYEMVSPAPAGSLAAPGTDMAKFMIAHLQNGSFNGVQILKPETARLMHETAYTVLPPLNRMLLGFYETNINGRRAISHGGDTQYFHSNLHLFIDDNVGLFISVNSGGKDGAAYPLRTALYEEFADRYLPGPDPSGKVDPKVAAEHAAMIAGVYDNSRRSASNFFAALNLPGQVTVSDNGDGTITVAGLDDLAGQPKVWREIAPFVWADSSGERLAAKVVDGRVVRFSVDQISPFMMFDRTPGWKSSAWLLPALYASIAALLLTVLAWPAAALVRRRYGAELTIAGADRKAFRWVRIGAVAALAVLLGWVGLVSLVSSDLVWLSSKIDPWLWLLQILSVVAFFGLLAAAIWNGWRVWKGNRRWTSKAWSIVLVAAGVIILWVALAYKLISFGTNF
ncbi:MAG TPA: serine hydrolase [Sphingomicrobium sp.]